MTSTLVCNSDGIFTGLPGDAMRATGAIRILNGRIAAMGDLAPEPGEEIIGASGCVIYPGLISMHHHLFQSVLKGVHAGITLPLMGWLRSVPHSYWHKVHEEELYTLTCRARAISGCMIRSPARSPEPAPPTS